MTIAELHRLLSGYRIRFNSERELQDGIERVLIGAALSFERECRLSDRDRIDFLCNRVGIEVKIASSYSQVLTQLFRYAQSPRLDSLLLITNKSRQLDMPKTILSKPVAVYFAGGYF